MKNQGSQDYMGREFVIIREFDAPRELVFQAWTDPEHLARWWGPRGFTNPVCDWEARPGRTIHVVMRAPNGTDYPMGGAFREVVAPERLVFTTGALDEQGKFLFEFLHTAEFAEAAGKTRLTLRSRVVSTTADANKYIGGFEAGMTQSLERLTEQLAPGGMPEREIVITRVFDAPRDLVWQAMTDPQQVIHWWGPRGFTTTIESMDVRPGGLWKHVMHGPDGTHYPNESVFREVVAPERLVLANAAGRAGDPQVHFLKIWTFEVMEPERTKVTIRMVFPSVAEREHVATKFGAIEGGRQTLERLSEHLAARSAGT